MGDRKRTWILLGRNIIWAAVIFILCTLPGDSIPNPHLNIPHLDKAVHFSMFFIMAVLLCNELEYQTRFRLRKIYAITVFIAFLYGGAIEVLQQHCFSRSGDVWDLVADVFGAVAGCGGYPQLKQAAGRIRRGKKK